MAHNSSRTDQHKHDRLIHWARFYDVGNRLLGRRGRRMRAMLADDLQLGPGDRVLDVGCGPGRLAMIFAERVLPGGSVHGIDPSPEMIKLATTRAQKDGIPISFQVAFAQQLPFPDATFDALSCTLALHHVAEDDQRAAVEEMYRVLKPGGRLLIAEFQKSGRHRHSGPRWLRRTGGEDMINKALDLINAAGFTGAATGRTNLGWLGRITARK
ncbi:MAG: class I SAM-dependent methyltransferase [Propionibacteriaceae bacterium]|jgi:ubiquinone/menaquinone biosynthesis C-methylase UbiE